MGLAEKSNNSVSFEATYCAVLKIWSFYTFDVLKEIVMYLFPVFNWFLILAFASFGCPITLFSTAKKHDLDYAKLCTITRTLIELTVVY